MLKFACLLLLFGPQDDIEALKNKVDELTKRVEALEAEKQTLETENIDVQKRIDAGEAELMELAREMFAMRRRMKAEGHTEKTGPYDPTKKADPKKDPIKKGVREVKKGPTFNIRGEIRGVRPEHKWIVINRGKRHGVELGFRFEVMRYADAESKTLGVAEVKKFMGDGQDMSLLELIEGDINRVQVDDAVVAIRKATDTKKKETFEAPKLKESTGFKITGNAGKKFVIDYGSKHGAKLTDKVWIYRARKNIGSFRLVDVQKDYSVGSVIESKFPPAAGDIISIHEPQKSLFGRIKWNDSERGIIIDVGSMQGAKAGQIFNVRRAGQTIGKLVLTIVSDSHSYGKAVGESKREDFRIKDFVEIDE